MHWPGLGTYQFGPFGDVDVFPAAGAPAATLQDTFVRGVLPVVLVGRGHEALHASGVLHGGHLVLFCARSGIGKSSLAFGLAARGGVQWADDTVLLAQGGNPADAMSLPFPPRVDDLARTAVGNARPEVAAPATLQPIARIFLLVRDPDVPVGRPAFEDVPPTTLFEQLVAHAHPFDLDGPARRRGMVERLLGLAGAVPGTWLRFAPSLPGLPALIDAVADRIDRD